MMMRFAVGTLVLATFQAACGPSDEHMDHSASSHQQSSSEEHHSETDHGQDHHGHETLDKSITIQQAYVRAPLGGRDVTAGYFQLKMDIDDRLIGAASPAVSSIEIHDHLEIDGRMAMRRQEFVKVKANETLVFEPGGLHLMFFGAEQLANTEELSVNLFFASGREKNITFEVVSGGHAGHSNP